ncbi:helix-turn-helix domain-containing protein [Cohnella sp. GCM10027633]|uniref:helix-turn-helix domain-containing protein n=1 Tax=unclassified Cohnella TaxID=2636738 RepID=UPI0036318A05
MTTFGTRLKQARANKKLTQIEVADKLGIDYTTISKYENNKSEPDNEILREMAGIYEVTLDWLISGQAPSGKPADAIYIDGVLESLTRDEALHLIDSLEMYRLLRAKRANGAAGNRAGKASRPTDDESEPGRHHGKQE